jgi:membrane-bound ClpP family serine protease
VNFSTGRLVVAIVTTLGQEAIIALIVLLGLPRIGVLVGIPGLAAIMVVWGIIAALLYRAGTFALTRKPVKGLSNMTGCKGTVIRSLNPQGLIKIQAELWDAQTEDGGTIQRGKEVEVVSQDGLKLKVRALNYETPNPKSETNS